MSPTSIETILTSIVLPESACSIRFSHRSARPYLPPFGVLTQQPRRVLDINQATTQVADLAILLVYG